MNRLLYATERTLALAVVQAALAAAVLFRIGRRLTR